MCQDVENLAKMTGKDFSGPTPTINVPDVPTLMPTKPAATRDESRGRKEPPPQKKKSQRNRPQVEDTGIIIGDADTYDS